MPIAWITFLYHYITNKPDRDCVFRGKFTTKSNVAVTPAIEVAQFKAISKKNYLYNMLGVSHFGCCTMSL